MAKGNDGKAARRRTMNKLIVSAIFALALVLGIVYFGENVSSSSDSKATTKSFHNNHDSNKEKKHDKDVTEGPNHRYRHHNNNEKHSRHNIGNGNENGNGGEGRKSKIDRFSDIRVGHHDRNQGRSHRGETDDQEGGNDDREFQPRHGKKNRRHVDGYGGRDTPQNWGGRHDVGERNDDGEEEEGVKYKRKVNYRDHDRGGGYDGRNGGRGEDHHNRHKKDNRRVEIHALGNDDIGDGRDSGGFGGRERGRGDEFVGRGRDRGDGEFAGRGRDRDRDRGDGEFAGRGRGVDEFGGGFGNRGNHMRPRHVARISDNGDGDDKEESDFNNNGDDRSNGEKSNEEEGKNRYQKNTDEIDDKLADQYFHELTNQDSNGNSKKTLEGILNGSLNLISIQGIPEKRSNDGSYDSVLGDFCKVNFDLHKKDPSSYPMFRFLEAASQDCQNPTRFNLKKVAYLARQRDNKIKEGEIVVDDKGPKVLNLTAVAFHESRCGSTLVANSMIAMDPAKHRAYSESPPPVYAMLHCCGEHFENCSQEQAAAVLRDTVYLMSRTDDPQEERVFFKFQSITSKAIPTFQMAFPKVPWMYVYRDPVQVMMSHVKDDPKMKKAICTRSKKFPPKEIKAIAKRHGRQDVKELTPSEYCAAHLAMLTESAANALDDMAIPVAYDQLPSMMWEKIMPKILGRALTKIEVGNLENISKSYSKGGKGKDKKGEFKPDSEQKEQNASEAIREAAKEFLKESFDQLAEFEPKLLSRRIN